MTIDKARAGELRDLFGFVWCTACEHSHIPTLPQVTFSCAGNGTGVGEHGGCGFGVWDLDLAVLHAGQWPEHIVYAHHHTTVAAAFEHGNLWALLAEGDGWEGIDGVALHATACDAVAWALIEATSDTSDRPPSQQTYREALATAQAILGHPRISDPVEAVLRRWESTAEDFEGMDPHLHGHAERLHWATVAREHAAEVRAAQRPS